MGRKQTQSADRRRYDHRAAHAAGFLRVHAAVQLLIAGNHQPSFRNVDEAIAAASSLCRSR